MLVIFDFDGTLADTRPALVAIFNRLSRLFNFQPIDAADLEKWRSLPAREVLRGLRINPILRYFVFWKARRELFHEMEQVVFAAPGLAESISQLARKPDYKLGILTSNSRINVERFLVLKGCREFQFVETSTTLWSKARSLRKIRKQYSRSGERVVYIGDEIRDIEAARAADVKIGVVDWGNNTREVLLAKNPDYFFRTPAEILHLG